MLITSCFITTITLLGNVGTIVAFWKVRGLREKPSNFFILNLSCTDLIMGVVHIFSISTYAAGYWIWGKTGCQIYVTLANIAVAGGILNTLLICWDRYLLISMEYPKYMKLQSERRVTRIITALWCYIIIGSFIEWMIWDTVKVPQTLYKFDYSQQCRSPPKHNFIFQTLKFSRNVFLPLILIEAFSVAFVVRLRRRLRRGARVRDGADSCNLPQGQQPGGLSMNRSNVPTVSKNTSASATVAITHAHGMASAHTSSNARRSGQTTTNTDVNQQRYVKAAITFTALIVALNVCLLPFVLYISLVSLVCPICSNGLIREILGIIVIPMNSCINPILYAVTMRKIKQFYLKMLRQNNRNA